MEDKSWTPENLWTNKTDLPSNVLTPGGKPRKKRGRPSKNDYALRIAEAAARGEVYPPPKKIKTLETADEKGAFMIATGAQDESKAFSNPAPTKIRKRLSKAKAPLENHPVSQATVDANPLRQPGEVPVLDTQNADLGPSESGLTSPMHGQIPARLAWHHYMFKPGPTSNEGRAHAWDNAPDGDNDCGFHYSSDQATAQDPRPSIVSPDNTLVPNNKGVQKNPASFQCEFCPKRYTRAYNLRSHLRTHMEERPFLCKVCAKTVASEQDCKRHEGLHVTEKKFECRGKLDHEPGEHWGCGRQFQTVDALGRHFQSNVGQVCLRTILDRRKNQYGISPGMLPAELLQRYPELFDLDWPSLAIEEKPSFGSTKSADSGYESATPFDPAEITPNASYQKGAYLRYFEDHIAQEADSLQRLPSIAESLGPTDSKGAFSLLTGAKPNTEKDTKNTSRPSWGCSDPKEASIGRLVGIERNTGSKSIKHIALPPSSQQSESQRHPSMMKQDFPQWSQPPDIFSANFDPFSGFYTNTNTEEPETLQKCEDVQVSDTGARSLSPGESSANSEPENGYISNTSETSVFSSSRRDLISRLMDEICTLFFSQASCSPRRHGDGAGSSMDSSTGSLQTSVGRSDRNNYVPSETPRKRTRNDDEGPDEEDDRKRKRRRTPNSISDDSLSTKMRCFACPFHKFDPLTYSNGNEDSRLALKYRSCGPPGWPTIGKMKEHLYRTHQTPIHCPRCWTIMKTEAALGEHVRASSQCVILPPPLRWIPREVLDKLKNRKKAFAGQTDEDTWRYIYGLLFPDSAKIPSPYYSDDMDPEEQIGSRSPTSSAVAAIEEYASAHLPRLVEEALETAVAQQTQPIEEGLRRALPDIVRECHSRLTQNFLQHRSSCQDMAGISVETLPSFYVPPLDLTNENPFINLDNVHSHEQETVNPPSDSGYASGTQSHTWNRREPPTEATMPPDLDSFFNSAYGFSDSELAALDLDCLNVPVAGEKADFNSSQELYDESLQP